MYYLDTGEKLLLKNGGRRMKEIKDYEEKIVIQAYKDQKVGARRLEKILDQEYGIHIPHNRIHKILLKNNMAKENEKKKRSRKKWIRDERRHSLSLLQ
jgi:putative transposase